MKPITTLYLLLNEETFRLVHTSDDGLAERSHAAKADHGDVCKHAATAVSDEWARGIYDRIVIVAGPKTLGEVRHALPAALHSHIAAELHKDLVNFSLHDLTAHFATVSAI